MMELKNEKVNYESVPKLLVLTAMISRFNNRYQAEADRFLGEISLKQMSFLRIIKAFREAPTVKDMADFIGCTHQNAHKLAKRLEDAGFITMIQDEHDRRCQRLILTEKADRLLSEQGETALSAVAKIFSALTEDETDYAIDIMSKLNALLDFDKQSVKE